jgi:hypothetical protein
MQALRANDESDFRIVADLEQILTALLKRINVAH